MQKLRGMRKLPFNFLINMRWDFKNIAIINNKVRQLFTGALSPNDTRRKNSLIMTSERRRDVGSTSQLLLLRRVPVGLVNMARLN